jgi:hypothetical protein
MDEAYKGSRPSQDRFIICQINIDVSRQMHQTTAKTATILAFRIRIIQQVLGWCNLSGEDSI